MRIEPIRVRLHEIFGFDFPADFWAFWQFYVQLPEKTADGFGAGLDISLGDIFRAFQVGIDLDAFNPAQDFTLFDAPPEFIPLWYSAGDNLYWGYYLDDPDHGAGSLVVSFSLRDDFVIIPEGYNLFEALRRRLEQTYQRYADKYETGQVDEETQEFYRRTLYKLHVTREVLQRYCTGERLEKGEAYLEKYAVERTFTTATRDRMGIIAPPETYQPIQNYEMIPDKFLEHNFHPTHEEVERLQKKALQLLSQGFPATALKLGKDLWTYPLYYKNAYALLENAYQALQRPGLATLLSWRKEKDSTEIPEFQQALLQAEKITTLILHDKNIHSLSSRIGELKNLQNLDLSFNSLEDLPIEFGMLQHLTTLNLNLNLFNTLPSVLLRLKNLQALYLKDNQLRNIPDTISQLQALEVLHLDNNKLDEFPRALTLLPRLQVLSLQDCAVYALPPEFEKFAQLTHFIWKLDNPIKYISADMSRLVRLHTLQIDGKGNYLNTQDKFSFPAEFCKLPALQSLKITSDTPINLPEELALLTHLDALTIDCAFLTTLPLIICKLKNLKTLKINFANLTELPAEFAMLTNLENLNLYGNQFTKAPEVLGLLPTLKSVNLLSNHFSKEEKEQLKKTLNGVLVQV
jgi:Leucine-rich repeat (LRR) protein